jgi:hypothetical protein
MVVLVETTSPASAREVRATPEYQALEDLLSGRSRRVHAIAASNVKRVGDVDKTRQGTFLFNYFVGDDPEVVMELWDYLAGWYETETGMDNSTLLAPLPDEKSDYGHQSRTLGRQPVWFRRPSVFEEELQDIPGRQLGCTQRGCDAGPVSVGLTSVGVGVPRSG